MAGLLLLPVAAYVAFIVWLIASGRSPFTDDDRS